MGGVYMTTIKSNICNRYWTWNYNMSCTEKLFLRKYLRNPPICWTVYLRQQKVLSKISFLFFCFFDKTRGEGSSYSFSHKRKWICELNTNMLIISIGQGAKTHNKIVNRQWNIEGLNKPTSVFHIPGEKNPPTSALRKHKRYQNKAKHPMII